MLNNKPQTLCAKMPLFKWLVNRKADFRSLRALVNEIAKSKVYLMVF